MGKIYNKYGEVIGYTDGPDYTDYSSAASQAKPGAITGQLLPAVAAEAGLTYPV